MNDLKRVLKNIIEIFVIASLIAFVEYYYFGFNNISFFFPINDQADGLTGIVGIKQLVDHDIWRMGWPYHMDTEAYAPVYNLLYRFFVFAISLFTKNYALIMNCFLFVIPWFNTIVAYYSFKNLKIKTVFSFLGAISFGFCPYVQYRFSAHMALGTIECVPLVFLMIFWIFEDDEYTIFGKGGAKNKKNWLTLLFTWMIANNGMIYYPFFSCLILCVVLFMCILDRKSIKYIISAIKIIVEIVIWIAIGFIPAVIGKLNHISGAATNGALRSAYRAVVYGLDIKSMLLSPKGYGLEYIKNMYLELLVVDNENGYCYLGIVAIIGFMLLLINLFKARSQNETRLDNRLYVLSRINVSILLFSVLGGLGVLVAILLPFISCYNRISPFIVYASDLTFVLYADYFWKKYEKGKQIIVALCVCIIMIASIFEMQGTYNYWREDDALQVKENVEADVQFFEEVETVAGDDGQIFMLPYMKSFENGPQNMISDYDHYRGYLYTKHVKWSYGAVLNSENDLWYAQTAALKVPDMIEELREKGFSGIYINLDGYMQEEGYSLVTRIMEETNCVRPVVHSGKRILYIPLNNDTCKQVEVINENNPTITYENNQYDMLLDNVQIESNEVYKISIEFNKDFSLPNNTGMFVDLYAQDYDNSAQEISNFWIEGTNKYTFYINTGKLNGEKKGVLLRWVLFSTDELELDSIIEKVELNKLLKVN